MSLLPRPYPGSSTTASIGVNMAFDDPATPPGHTASPRAKGGGLVPLSLLIATVRREWGVLGALAQVEHRVCKAIFLGHWLRSLRTYKVCLKLFARCPMKTHLHVDSLGFQSQKRPCLRPQGRFTYVQATCFSETWCHFCQTEWVKIQLSICWRVEEERILTKHKDVNFWEEARIKYSFF